MFVHYEICINNSFPPEALSHWINSKTEALKALSTFRKEHPDAYIMKCVHTVYRMPRKGWQTKGAKR